MKPVVGSRDIMDSAVLWMADQICPLLTYIGLSACTAKTDLYLVGVAGWIFGGLGLLMLMGISEATEDRKAAQGKHAAQKPHRTSFSAQLAIIEPALHMAHHSSYARRLKHKRVRPLKGRHGSRAKTSRSASDNGPNLAASIP